jgi:hypothetical protein
MKIVRYGCVAVLVMMMTTVAAFGQLSGTYYVGTSGTKPGGGDPDYLTLKSAMEALNDLGITGNVTMYITSSLTETENVALGLNTGGFTVTFKPATGITPTIAFTKTTDNAGPSGSWIIGADSVGVITASIWTLIQTDNIIIDGSNTVNGTTRDLTMTFADSPNPFGISVVGNANNITIKNCVLTNNEVGANSAYCVSIRPRNQSSTNYIPDIIIIENNTLTSNGGTAGQPIGITASGTVTSGTTSDSIVIRNNLINARTRAIFANAGKNYDIYNNEIKVNQTTSGNFSHGIYFLSANSATSIVNNIYNNNFTQLATSNTSAGEFGISGITPSYAGTFNIYNNTFAGFSTGTTSNGLCNAIRVTTNAAVVLNAYHNTINMVELNMNTLSATTGTGTNQNVAAFSFSTATPTYTATLKNNIVVMQETDSCSFILRRAVNTSTIVSDYNNIYFTGTKGTFSHTIPTGAIYGSLAGWNTASSQDANSKTVSMTFTSATDLHLSGGSLGDLNLIGVTGLGVSTDIDGDSRSGTNPYMGADEGATLLPVELTGFTAISRGKNIELRWNTATETNNFGFEVERALTVGGGQQWTKVGFVPGAGTSNVPKEYSYSDAVSGSGRVTYRLKQIDIDGHFTYHNAIEVTVNAAAANYELAQNFPNPFNPNTTIRFSVKQMEQTSVKVYDIAGREVAVLFNEVANAGQVYNVQFNASGLASGIYFYVLQTQSYREVKKMSLLK